jgi:hypothetical protein
MTLNKIKKVGVFSNAADSLEIAARAKHVNPIIDKVNTISPTDTSLVTDTIAESTTAAGVTIDGVILKDSNITVASSITSTSTLTTVMPVTAPGVGFDTANGIKFATYGKRGASGLFVTDIYVDLKTAAVSSSTTDLDIIGEAAGGVAYIAQVTAANMGTVVAISMTCLEAPTTGVTDIDLYAATEGTGVFDGGIAALVETALITAGGAWTNGATKGAIALPTADQYLYLTSGAAGTAGAYASGKFLITIYGI